MKPKAWEAIDLLLAGAMCVGAGMTLPPNRELGFYIWLVAMLLGLVTWVIKRIYTGKW